MVKRKFLGLIRILSLLLLFVATSCSTGGKPQEPVKLKIAVLPILDALPMYVAEENGYFADQGVQVEFIPVSSAAERDQIMAAGQADGMINDLISTLLYNQDTIQIQIVSFARVATPDFPQYRILAAKDSGITNVEDLKGVEIGISEGSVIEYTTDRFLQAEGFSPMDIATIAVPSIAIRMSLLDSGELKAANLPDPLSSLAIQGGAVPIIDDTTYPEYGNSLISFRKSVIDANQDAIRGFLQAIDQAVEDINTNPSKWDQLLTEKNLVPAPLIGSYDIPTFPSGAVPSRSQWEDVVDWGLEKGLISTDISYDDSVTTEYLP
ncbi:MAG: ABC transporter substrate-binding protein [Chloroflexota bacterium]|nr:MAG: ABC transporter substrate-binding protein [Chloroflexota bacterium]